SWRATPVTYGAVRNNRVERERRNRRSPRRERRRAVSNEPKTTSFKKGNNGDKDTNDFSPFTSHYSPFAIRFHSYRTCSCRLCAFAQNASGNPGTGRRLCWEQHG